MTIKVFASGQSNMLGAGTGGPTMSGVSADVSVWNSVAPFGSVGSAFVTAAAAQAAGTFQFTDRNNMAVWFCDKLARTQFDTVTLALAARNGSSIDLWSPDEVTNPMFGRCVDVWTATGQDPADVFLWHQGESDVSMISYRNKFRALVENLIDAGVLSAKTLILIGGIAENNAATATFNQKKLQGLCGGKTTYANSHLCPTYDTVHFTGQGLYAFGASRLYSAYLLARVM
jgi:hypothetical protein